MKSDFERDGVLNNRNMYFWLLKHYIKLSKFMDIKLNALGWEVGYKISYNLLNEEQKKLSDEFTMRLRNIEFGDEK